MKQLTIFLLDFYHYFLSFDKGLFSIFAPGGACKYSPSCSVYTKQMVLEYGAIKGLSLGLKQFINCR